MNASLLQMLGTPWRTRDRERPWGRRLMGGLLALLFAVGLAGLPGAAKLMLLVFGSCLVMAGAWTAIAASLLLQNHPHPAHLVPGHLRRLREAALLAWGVTTLSCGLLSWLCLPLPSLPAALLGSAAVLTLIALFLHNWALCLLLALSPPLFSAAGLNGLLGHPAQALLDAWRAQPWAMLTLSLLAMAALIAHLFGKGNSAHRDAYARRVRLQRLTTEGMTGDRPDLAGMSRWQEWLGRLIDKVASAWMRHALQRAEPTASSVMQRAEIVLHGTQHWLRVATNIAVVLPLLSLGGLLVVLLAGEHVQDHWAASSFGLAIGISSVGLNPALMLPNMLWHSRREQALLRLLPGMPQGGMQNRAVAWLQLRHALVAWALTTTALALLAWVAHAPGLLCLGLAALPVIALCLLRSPARLHQPGVGHAVLSALAYLGGGGALSAVYRAGVPMEALATGCIATALALGLWRWRAVCRAPVPLPAGRLG